MTGNNSKQEMSYPPGVYVPVYITAKRIHAPMLLDLRKDHPNIYFTARWPVVRDISSEQLRPARLWFQDNVADMTRAEAVIHYAEKDDLLSGSLVELGVAWAHGKDIYLCGENAGYKEWQAAPRIKHGLSIGDALTEIADRIRYRETDADRIMAAVKDTRLEVGVVVDLIKGGR